MSKTIGKKTLIAILSVLLGLGLTACGEKTTESTAENGAVIPGLSDPDAVFYHNGSGSVTVTYGQLYEEFKINDGINQLLFMVDSVLLSDYIAAVTAEELVEKEKNLKFGITDDDLIAEIPADEVAKYEEYYAQNMLLLGYSGNEEEYLRMVCAKENYAIDAMTDPANEDETWYVGAEAIADYYEDDWFVDAKAIKIKFLSQTDAEAVLRSFNLVSYHGELRLYTGTKPIDTLSSASFNDTNTRILTEAELLAYFIRMYNFVYGGYRDTIAEDATVADVKAVPEVNQVYKTVAEAQSSLASYLFSTLGSYDEYVADPEDASLYYTYAPVKYYGSSDTAYYMILKLTDTAKEDVSGFSADTDDLAAIIGQDVYDDILDLLITDSIETSGFVSDRISDLRAEHAFVIHDYYLGVDYQAVDTSFELDEEGSESIIATFDSITITADDFLAFAMEKNGALYSLYATQFAHVFDLHFADVYCTEGEACETDLDVNDSEKLAEHVETLADLKTSFEASSYAAYYTFAEYIYLAYGAKSEDEMIKKYYIKSTLQPYVIYDRIIADEWALLEDYLYDLVQDYYDNYFSLDVDYLRIYVDRDEDGEADDYEEFLAGLDDQGAYETLLADFEADIRAYFEADDTLTYSNLISDFNKAKRTDAVWGSYKQYGFMLSTENLSASDSLTYLNTVDGYDDALIDGFIAAYAEYNLIENVDADYLYYSELVVAGDGAYLLYCEKGTDFTKPSAAFTMTYETDNVTPKYTPGTENDGEMPSLAQLKLYCEYRFYEIVYGTADDVEETYGITLPEIPATVTAAIEAYFTDLHDSMYVVGFLNIIIAEHLQEGVFTGSIAGYAADDVALKALIDLISDVYFEQVFEAYDTVE